MTFPTIDLRSDTVTRPTTDMRAAMMAAPLGDDVLGDDPTVNALEAKVAALLGKPAACFVPSGTMANQTAIRAQTEPGDEVICHGNSHIIHYESGGPAALSGVSIRPIEGPHGFFGPDDIDPLVRPENDHFGRSRLVVLENTNNRGGGSVWHVEHVAAVCARARKFGLRTHLDGARLWNACVASGNSPADYGQHFDSISVCFSKGLGTPAGSAVAADVETIKRVRRFRKMFGGAMRQSGILAGAAIYALDHHRERMKEDHASAREFGEGLARIGGLRVNAEEIRTNMVFFDLDPSLSIDAQGLVERLKARGVLVLATAPRRIRAVTHLDVAPGMIPKAIEAVRAALG
jgi:threonine aldolase